MADLSSIVAGAYYALVTVFVFSGVGFWIATRDRIYAYFSLHVVAVGALALTFPPVSPAASAVEGWHIAVRMAAEGLVIATAGLLIAQLLENVAPRWLRWPIRSVYAIGLILAASSLWFMSNVDAIAIFGAGAALAMGIMAVSILVCIVRRSRDALFIGIAFGPLIAVGGVAAVMEALGLEPMRHYVEGILMGFAFELLFVTGALATRFNAAMKQRDEALKEALDARRESETDQLTSLPNRRAFDNALAGAPGARYEAIAIMDCDHFKAINDRYGHSVGDAVLRSIASTLLDIDGVAMRIGGEEFGLFLKSQTWEHDLVKLCQEITQRVRADVSELDWPATVSIGAVGLTPDVRPEMAMMLADDALYSAKANGRNCVEIYLGKTERMDAEVLANAA